MTAVRGLRVPTSELVTLFAHVMPNYLLIQFLGLAKPLFGLVCDD